MASLCSLLASVLKIEVCVALKKDVPEELVSPCTRLPSSQNMDFEESRFIFANLIQSLPLSFKKGNQTSGTYALLWAMSASLCGAIG